MIEYYNFEIKPFYWNGEHGTQKELHVTIQVDGEKHSMVRVLPDQRPFESEVEYYARMATEMLTEKLKQLDKEKALTSKP